MGKLFFQSTSVGPRNAKEMAGDGRDNAASAAEAGPVKGFRFRTSGTTVGWRDEMESVSPFLAAMARKVADPEGCSVEVDETGHVLVDDSSYSPKVIDVLVTALESKHLRLDVGQLDVEDLLEYLKCADFHQLPDRCTHQARAALWNQMSSRWAESTSVLQFKQIQFKEPLVLDYLNMNGGVIEELLLHNVSIKKSVSLSDVEFADSSLSLGIGSELWATNTVFKNSKLMFVCQKAVLESCTLQDSSWEGPVGQSLDLTIKSGVLRSVQLPPVESLTLQEVSMEACKLPRCNGLSLMGKCSFEGTALPRCGSMQLTDVDLDSMSLRCDSLNVTKGSLTRITLRCRSASKELPSAEPGWRSSMDLTLAETFLSSFSARDRVRRATLTQVDAEELELHATHLTFDGACRLKECRLWQDRAAQGTPSTGPIMASGCVFRGMTFPIDTSALSFKDCTFYRCTFLLEEVEGGHGAVFDNCTLVAVSTQLRLRQSWRRPDLKSLAKNFHTPCQVVADLSEVPEGIAATHLEWIRAE